MKTAYGEELSKTMEGLDAAKIALETWYAKRIPEKDIVDAVKTTYDELMALGDQEINRFTGTTKSIRNAMVPYQFNIGYMTYIHIYIYTYISSTSRSVLG